ncbi:hypothetical protein ACHAW6_012020 [Cyclotella cf. meneghiniana]
MESESILLKEDENDLFGEEEEEEEEEEADVDMAPPVTKVKEEDNEVIDDDMFGDEEEEEEDQDDDIGMPSSDAASPPSPPPADVPANTSYTQTQDDTTIPTVKPTLPPPSPFPHHNAGPTSDRLRNATHRIAAAPTRDAEAWSALMTEVVSCWRSLLPLLDSVAIAPSGNIEQEELWRKVEWIELCYLALLHNFPHATVYIAQLAMVYIRLAAVTPDEIQQCARTDQAMGTYAGAPSSLWNGTITPSSLMLTEVRSSQRQQLYNNKLDQLFFDHLGVTPDGSPALHIPPDSSLDAMAATTVTGARTILPRITHSIDLWMLYIRKRNWDAIRSACADFPIPPPPVGYTPHITQVSVLLQRYEESLRAAYRSRKDAIRDGTQSAYEVALGGGAGFVNENHVVWRSYVAFVRGWTDPIDCSFVSMGAKVPIPPSDPGHDHTVLQKQLMALRSVYQRGVVHPMTGLDQLWQEYEAFERQHSEALASVLVAEWLPKYQHARGVYLERGRVWNASELRGGRLAVPPVGCEGGSGTTMLGMTSRSAGGGGGSSAATGGMVDDDDYADYAGETPIAGAASAKSTSDAEYIAQMEEERALLSKWRRRAAYERTNPERLNSSDLVDRVRVGYCEEACAFARHPEVWYEWSQWELLHGSSVAASVAVTSGQQAATTPTGGNINISSAMLIAPAIAGNLKSGGNAIRALAVLTLGMESLPDSALLAQAQADILERHLGVLTGVNGEKSNGSAPNECIKVMERFVGRSPTTLGFVLLQRLVRRYEGIEAARAVFSRARRTLRIREEDDMEDADESAADVAADAGKGAARRMVTSRLKGMSRQNPLAADEGSKVGFITWHLYAAHATIEHRLGKNPQVAARIYELGLRKHRSFISTPPYVLHYANLLLELNDEENLRSLLMRAVAACEEEDANISANPGESEAAALARRREVQRPLWDMMLKFESILSSRTNNGNVAADVAAIEMRRRRALFGPGNEDVVMGREGPPDEEDLSIGIQKSSLNEQLIRVEGYDVASRIANGMARMVDVLSVTGAIGNGEFDTSSLDFASAASASLAAGGVSSNMWGDVCAGGASDVSYVQRLRFQRETGIRAVTSTLPGVSAGSQGITGGAGKLLSSKERVAGAGLGMNVLLIQSAPEWLRPLLLLLPPIPKFGRGLQKPPPHLIEMALLTLRGNALPQRPVVEASISNGAFTIPKKHGRQVNNGEDSSDDEDGGDGGGYSNQFRARQRARLIANGSAVP